MAQIEFTFGVTNRLRAACRLLHTHYLAGQRIVVYCNNNERLSKLDLMLWNFDDIAFIPHVFVDSPLSKDTPIILTKHHSENMFFLAESCHAPSLLLNLDNECPPHYSFYDRLLEVVSNCEMDRSFARERWRTYASHGCKIQSSKDG